MTEDAKTAQILARKARYAKIERVADTVGRLIGVKRLTPAQQLRVQGFCPELDGTYTPTDEDGQAMRDPKTGKLFMVPKSAPLLLAAAVCEVDNMPMPFAQSRRELDATLDMLDIEGMAAASLGLSRLEAADKQAAEALGSETQADAAKN